MTSFFQRIVSFKLSVFAFICSSLFLCTSTLAFDGVKSKDFDSVTINTAKGKISLAKLMKSNYRCRYFGTWEDSQTINITGECLIGKFFPVEINFFLMRDVVLYYCRRNAECIKRMHNYDSALNDYSNLSEMLENISRRYYEYKHENLLLDYVHKNVSYTIKLNNSEVESIEQSITYGCQHRSTGTTENIKDVNLLFFPSFSEEFTQELHKLHPSIFPLPQNK